MNHVLNQCVFQWAAVTSDQIATAKSLIAHANHSWTDEVDWDALSRTCEEQLEVTQGLIDGTAFDTSLDNLLQGSKAKLATGYGCAYNSYNGETNNI